MAGKPELSASSGVQNVVVYVSNDNFAQAYAVGQQNVPPNLSQNHPSVHNGAYGNQSHQQQHPMAPMVDSSKCYNPPGKQNLLKPPDYASSPQQTYYTEVLSQNNFSPIVNNIGYPNGPIFGPNKTYNDGNAEVPAEQRQSGPGRPDCDPDASYVDSSTYVAVMGAECPQQNVRCDSVRSETAESSCSSSSSNDEGVVQNNTTDNMVVYDPSVSVRPGGVVLTVGPRTNTVIGHQTFVSVPFGWKRLLNNGSVIYISPSNTVLNDPEQIKEYLLTSGTCKCGLECHFKYENVFNFDPKVASKPWTFSPDTTIGDLTKLCNHKRKIMAMAGMDCKPHDPNLKLRKDYNIKRKKRRIEMPPHCDPMPVQQVFARRDKLANQQVWNAHNQQRQHQQQQQQHQQMQIMNRLHGYPDNIQLNQTPAMDNYQQQQQHVSSNISPSELQNASPQMLNSNPNVHVHHQSIVTPVGNQIINLKGPAPNQNLMMNQQMFAAGQKFGGNVPHNHPHPQRVYVNGQPSEPSGPGRPIQMIPIGIDQQQRSVDVQQRLNQQQHQQFYNNGNPQYDPMKNVRPFMPPNGFRPHIIHHQQHQQQQQQQQNQMMQQQMMINQQNQQKAQWQNRLTAPPVQNMYERVPPLHHPSSPLMWHEEVKKKKVKLGKVSKHRGYVMECQPTQGPQCPNVDVRQIPNNDSNDRGVVMNPISSQPNQNAPGPSFMEDPSGYLAQQTALLNNTINRQTGSCGVGYICNSPSSSTMHASQNTNEVPLPSNVTQIKQNIIHRPTQQQQQKNPQHYITQVIPDSSAVSDQKHHQHHNQHHHQQQQHQQHIQCQGCIADSMNCNNQQFLINQGQQKLLQYSRPSSQPGTPSSSGGIDDVSSSTFSDKQSVQNSPDNRPIQGGTVSTSNVSPIDGGLHSGPSTPNPHTPSSMTPNPYSVTPAPSPSSQSHQPTSQPYMVQRISDSQTGQNYIVYSSSEEGYNSGPPPKSEYYINDNHPRVSGVVTTMASGRTVGSNTITSVLAGRANTATVSVNGGPPQISSPPVSMQIQTIPQQHQPITVNVSKSPLEMVQSVVSSIQVPPPQTSNNGSQISPTTMVKQQQQQKQQQQSLPPGHILVSSGGQLIMTNNCQTNVMPPPPPKIVSAQQTSSAMPPISASPMVTNVTAAVTQMIPAVAQQMLGQQTVLVNALPAPFVLQPGVTMTMDGVTVGQNVQLPQIVTGNVIHQQQVQIDTDQRRAQGMLSPESKKKGKKRKIPSQTVAGMLQIAAQQNTGMVMQQQGFPQQIQMAHSPQGITAGPVMQALTIVPSKNGAPAQIVMNGQPNIGTQQLITANSQPTQQINLLQPVNLINGSAGVVQNFPTFQQFIVPNLGGMVMNPDGTATILQDTSNIGMQLQLQNVNGQNILTPVQNGNVFNGSQNIIAAGPAGMVIRTPQPSQGKLIQQQHSPGAQFLSPNGGQFVVNGGQFSGQLSPLVAGVSPTQQVTFSSPPQQIRSTPSSEYIQCNQMGQTLMVPAAQAQNAANQNTTYVQQNTTIVQQQTTMVSNNQQQQNQQRTTTLNVDHNFLISSNNGNENKQQLQQVVVKECSPNQQAYHHRQSVSTQTATNQSQAVTTNTFCQTSTVSAGSPPDTTTHSPLALGGQSPQTVDTTTHSGSTDDGLSPAPSNCSTSFHDIRHQPIAMVHCVSSSEPDSAGSEGDCMRSQLMTGSKSEYGEMHYVNRKSTPTHFAYAESSTMVHFLTDQSKSDETMVSSRHLDKRRSSDALLVMETKQLHFDDDEELVENERETNFVIGDLVWGPARGCAAWPGKIVDFDDDKATVKWYGNEKSTAVIEKSRLQSLSEGLEAHHRARKKIRTSRKLNSQLENAIQEAMAELDKTTELKPGKSTGSKKSMSVETISGRLRSSHK